MPKATHTDTTSMPPLRRRGIVGSLAGVFALSAAGATAVAMQPVDQTDAELREIGAAAIPLIKEYLGHYRAFADIEADDPNILRVGLAGESSYAALEHLTDRAVELRATTLDGFLAKVRLAQFWMLMEHSTHYELDLSYAGFDAKLAWSTFADMLGGELSA